MNVESFKIDDWEDLQTGIILLENSDWLLTKYIPVDYVTDGFKLYNKAYVTNRINGENERKIERVLTLKGEEPIIPEGFAFLDTIGLLEWVQEKFDIFEFADEEEDSVFYGRISKYFNSTLIIDFIDSDGKVDKDYDYEFDIAEIRSIAFQTDYFTSIRLLWHDEIKKSKSTL
jgi:hypothetical protein